MSAAVAAPGPGDGRSTHRLLPAEMVRERFPRAADYILSVRAELVACYGEIDTYSRFAAAIGAQRSGRLPAKQDRRAMARRRGDHFNSHNGPPWKTVEEVLRLAVPPARVAECRQRFIELYTAARGEVPPVVDQTADPAPPGVPRQASPPAAETSLRRLIEDDRLERRVAELEAELVTLRESAERYRIHAAYANHQVSDLQAKLAATQTEAAGLRNVLAAVRARQAEGKRQTLLSVRWQRSRYDGADPPRPAPRQWHPLDDLPPEASPPPPPHIGLGRPTGRAPVPSSMPYPTPTPPQRWWDERTGPLPIVRPHPRPHHSTITDPAPAGPADDDPTPEPP